MEKMRQWLRTRDFACALWVGLCFAVTSAVYLSWLNDLVALTGGLAADWLSLVAGYLCQAAGLAVVALLLRRDPNADYGRIFTAGAALFAAFSVPALLRTFRAGMICFGLLMNVMCGVLAGLYLYATGMKAQRRCAVFGGGYALGTVAVGLLALIGEGSLLHGRLAPLLCVLGTVAMALSSARLRPLERDDAASPQAKNGDLALACGVVILISAVKNLGFAFPSADIEAGLSPELSRLHYAIGLAAAGWINDRSRKDGMICTVAALVIPFIMLGMTGEPVPSAICWALEYLFFGFFSLFRVALFLDIACRLRRWELAPLGLLTGRLGDAAGTSISLLLAGQKLALVCVTALLFIPAVILFFRLYQRLYEPEAVQQRSEQEVFETFCLHNDLSVREREVLRMIIAKRTNGEIAEALFITESTVKYHVRNVLQKTGCKNRNELHRKYMTALYPQLRGNEPELSAGSGEG